MTAMITYSKDQCYTKEKQDMATMAKKFCPLLRANCRSDCTCFVAAKYNRIRKTNKYTYWGPYCTSPLNTGTIAVEML